MNLNKHLEFLEPASYDKPIHVIGVGAVGSRIVEQLVRLGFTNLYLYDFDVVEDYNVTNQLYYNTDIGKPKLHALVTHMKQINPLCEYRLFEQGYTGQALSGAVFLAVDSIDLRREIVEANEYNNNIDIMFDCRMRLTDAQAYAGIWKDHGSITRFLQTMQFTDEDAEKATPVSVCGTTLSVSPTVITIAALTVANFINFIRKEDEFKVKESIFIDDFLHTLVYY